MITTALDCDILRLIFKSGITSQLVVNFLTDYFQVVHPYVVNFKHTD